MGRAMRARRLILVERRRDSKRIGTDTVHEVRGPPSRTGLRIVLCELAQDLPPAASPTRMPT